MSGCSSLQALLLDLAKRAEGAVEGPVVRSGVAMADLEERMVDIIPTVENFGFAIADAAEPPGILAHFGY